MDKQSLRQKILGIRGQLSTDSIIKQSEAIAQNLFQQSFFQNATNIALYKACKGEVLTQTILEFALNQQKKCFLPSLSKANDRQLIFVEYNINSPLIPNRYGILESQSSNIIENLSDLDLVLVPLVAFDENKNRLGMGKGYYDITFFSRKNKYPLLIGLAYELQKVEKVPTTNLDVSLDMIITEDKIY